MTRDAPPRIVALPMRVVVSMFVALPWAVANAADGSPTAATGNPADCSKLDDARSRLACFDRHFPRAPEARAPAAPVAASAAPAAAMDERDAAAREALFGLDDTVRRNRGEGPVRPEAPQRIESVIAQLEPLGPGRQRITLANGQVWEQLEAGAGFLPRVGATVSVRQAALNSFLMRGRSGGAVRARRLR